jgi:hypothetical protein
MRRLAVDSYSEVRRVREEMSAAAGNDIRKLAAIFNARRAEVSGRIIDPGTQAEECAAYSADEQPDSSECATPDKCGR